MVVNLVINWRGDLNELPVVKNSFLSGGRSVDFELASGKFMPVGEEIFKNEQTVTVLRDDAGAPVHIKVNFAWMKQKGFQCQNYAPGNDDVEKEIKVVALKSEESQTFTCADYVSEVEDLMAEVDFPLEKVREALERARGSSQRGDEAECRRIFDDYSAKLIVWVTISSPEHYERWEEVDRMRETLGLE